MILTDNTGMVSGFAWVIAAWYNDGRYLEKRVLVTPWTKLQLWRAKRAKEKLS